ncbi:MAG TPA: orotidine 5'-phosphate decarboxylase / HUMPS family protein, partial [Acidimicrobiales bacterium]|nr:orotidine 5'-phosphate decarboxylase / HUMPS family protein [Acidimicrobiales bacterium]
PAPCVLGVTILTSAAEAPVDVLAERAALAAESGCGGVVCAASDLEVVGRAAPGLLRVVPGIRPPGVAADDQARAASPAAALAAGADLLVIGRAVTSAAHPERVARMLLEEVTGSFAVSS